MIVYNKLALLVLKKRFNLNNKEVAEVIGVRTENSISRRLSGETPLSVTEIAALCNHTEKIAKQFPGLKPFTFTPSDFYDEIEEETN